MEKKYINEKMYKKTSRVNRNKRSLKKSVLNKEQKPIKSKKEKSKVQNKKIKNRIKLNKRSKIKFVYFTLFLIIVILLRLILKDSSSPFIPNIFDRSYINNDTLRIGIVDNKLNDENSSNIILRELSLYSNPSLIKIGKDYEVAYEVIKEVNKVSNKEYILFIDEKYNITKEEIKASLDKYMEQTSIYYNNVSNIESVNYIDDNSIQIILKEDDYSFIYNLNMPIIQDIDITQEKALKEIMSNYYISYISPKKVIYTRSEKASKENIKEVIIISVSDIQDAITKYKNNEIDMFFSNSNQILQQLNDFEYNILTYKTGKFSMLLANSESETVGNKSIREAINLSIDMNKITDETYLNETFSTICIPYIYNNCLDIYDVYGAENILLANGYTKQNGIYKKMQDNKEISLDLDLLVNKDDIKKIEVANNIKEDLSNIGIKLNIISLLEDEIKNRVNNKNFDLVFADITVNEKPDIEFLKEYVYINDILIDSGNKFKNSNLENFNENLNYFEQTIIEEVPIIGVLSEDNIIIYNNNIDKIKYIEYMNIFNELMGI